MRKYKSVFVCVATLMIVTAMCFTIMPIEAQADWYNGVCYKISGGEAVILGVDLGISVCTIPSTINGYPVKRIQEYAFANNYELKSITIPESVVNVGYAAFWSCNNLTNVTFLGGSPYIDGFAFAYCSNLKSINMPSSISGFGDELFLGCSNLKYNVYNNAKYLGNNENPYVMLVESTNDSIRSCEIHPNTACINIDSFADCVNLTQITIPDSVQCIGVNAFKNCKLESITTPLVKMVPYVNTSSDHWFTMDHLGINKECLKYATFTSDYGQFSSPVFDGCSNLVRVVFSNNVDNMACIESRAFANCSNLASVNIPNSVTKIAKDAFEYCGLRTITIPDSVTYIGHSAFQHWEALTDITIPDSVTTIDENAFAFCTNLTSVNIGNGVTAINNRLFYACTNLTDLTYGKNLKKVWNSFTFEGCDNLKNIHFTGTVKEWLESGIAMGGIIGNDSMNVYVNGELVEGIVHIPSEVIEIPDNFFRNYGRIICINIPSSIAKIGNSAFYDCTNLDHIGYQGTQAQWEKIYASNRTDLKNAIIHCNVYDAVVKQDSGYDISYYCNKCKVCISYESQVASIDIYTLPNKLEYFGKRDVLDVTGGSILVHKTDGNSVTVPMTAQMVSGFDNAVAGEQMLTVTLNGETAVYNVKIITATVTFCNADGTILSEKEYMYGDTVVEPATPTKPAGVADDYVFCGWDKPVSVCTGNAVYTAVFEFAYKTGDINGDDKINSLDGLLLQRYLNGWNVTIAFPEAMDVNKDGKVNSLDGLILMRYLNGWSITLG